MYLLYSVRSQGWLTTNATYSSDVKDAKEFSREDALEMVKRQRERGVHRMIPVRKEDL